jgi:hypothetical protein
MIKPAGAAGRGLRRAGVSALVCVLGLAAAGCHRNNIDSGYGIAWVTLTDDPGDFTSYIVTVDSITLTRNDGAVVTALATPERVDFTKLSNIEELWGSATIPIGTYVSASIALDYTYADVWVNVGGVPQKATVVDSAANATTTSGVVGLVTVNVVLDASQPLTIAPTYATTAAERLAIDFNLAASTSSINLGTSPVTVTVKPYLTVAIAPPDNKLIRVRGPLINSSVQLNSYTVYVRPFFDEGNNLGSLSLFADADTIFALNGKVYTGSTASSGGITNLSQTSAGTTVTAAYTTYTPTPTPSATAGIFHPKYVIAGSTLEDVYSQGLEGDVIARSGDTLTLRGATLQVNSPQANGGYSYYNYNNLDATLTVGPNTVVTADDTLATNLTSADIAVGQHIIARGELLNAELPASGPVIVNATNPNSANTGSVRLISTNLWGQLVSAGAGNLLLNLQTINEWPVGVFNFAGNGTSSATDPVAASFAVNTGALALPDTTPGDPLWINGLVAPFGSAPPAFTASAVYDELGLQTAGAATGGTACGQGSADCVPASLRVVWASPGTSAPFSSLTSTGFSVNLASSNFSSGVIRIGPESIDLTTLAASPTIVATAPPAPVTATASAPGSVQQTLPPLFLPSYSYGDPTGVASTTTPDVGVNVFSLFATFEAGLTTALSSTPALQLEARGTYNRATNTFTAISVAVVL